MIDFVWPVTSGEWLASLAAFAFIVVGAGLVVAPRLFMRAAGFGASVADPTATSEIRGAVGGVWLGLGLAALLLMQPLIHLALGAGMACAVIARLIGVLIERRMPPFVILATLFEATIALACLAWPLGWVA